MLPCGFLSSLAEDEVDVAKPPKKRATRQCRDGEAEECPENYQSSDEDNYVPQISEVPVITSERFIREYNVLRKPVKVSDIPSVPNDDTEMMIPSEAEYLPGTENSADTQYLPEAESSSGHEEPVRGNLNERSHSPQVEQQTLDVPDVPLQRSRLESAEPDESEEETDQDESEDESHLRKSKRVKQKSKRLTYPELGNPMISIIQSLLQGLNTAFVESLAEQPRSIRHSKP